MRSLRRTINLRNGVEVKTLYTPHLFSFKGYKGLTFEAPATSSEGAVFELYADVMYAAALNAWVLDNGADPEDFGYTRGDFHEYMTLNPKSFASDVAFIIEALTGKSAKEVVKDEETKEVVKDDKKKASHWTGRILSRSS